MLKEKKNPIFCEHANENPAICHCPKDCYCRENTCKDKLSEELLKTVGMGKEVKRPEFFTIKTEKDLSYRTYDYLENEISSLVKEKKILEGNIVDFRMKLKDFVTKEDKERLEKYVKYEESEVEIGALIREIENNTIIKFYDEYFGIETKTKGKI